MDQPDLLMLLSDVGRMLRTEIDRRASAHNMTRAQWVILLRLSYQPGLSQKELSELLEVEPITVARLVDRLEAREMLERRPDPSDRRVWRLHLKPAAKSILDQVEWHRADLTEKVTAKLDPETVEATVKALRCMRSILSKRCDTEQAA